MKKLTKRQREMSRDTYKQLAWNIENYKNGIARREASGGTADDLPEMREQLQRWQNLYAVAIIICETQGEYNDICENSWN